MRGLDANAMTGDLCQTFQDLAVQTRQRIGAARDSGMRSTSSPWWEFPQLPRSSVVRWRSCGRSLWQSSVPALIG